MLDDGTHATCYDCEVTILSRVSSSRVYFTQDQEELFIFENPAFPRDVVRKIDGQRHKNVKIVTGLFVAHKLEGVIRPPVRRSITLWCHGRGSERARAGMCIALDVMDDRQGRCHTSGLPLFGNGSCVRGGQSLSLNLFLSASFLSLFYLVCPSEPAIHVVLMWIEDTITSYNEHLVTAVSPQGRWMDTRQRCNPLVESLDWKLSSLDQRF